jgi:putative oxidoreductase
LARFVGSAAAQHRIAVARKHSVGGIIPMLLCETLAISLWRHAFPQSRDAIPIRRVTDIGGTFMNETIAAWAPRALSLLRVITGLMIIQHGMAKIIGFPAAPTVANIPPPSLVGVSGFIELIGGALLILGLLTRPAAFILAGEMGVGYFIVHAPKSFFPLLNGGTLAIMYCFTCLYLSTAGAGPWSVDAAMKRD